MAVIAVDVVMPQMGVSVSEGTVTKWLKSVGDPIIADEPLLEISTDKVDTEVPSPGQGVLAEILVQEGETVPVGTRIATILPEGARIAEAEERPVAPPTYPGPTEPIAAPDPQQGASLEVPPEEAREASEPLDGADGHTEEHAFVSPVVARIASEHGVDVSRVPGTGQGGRVTKRDILEFIEATGGAPPSEAEAAAPPPSAPPTSPAAQLPAAPPPTPVAPPALRAPPRPETQPVGGETVEPMTVMRKAIAEHMIRSVHTSAHVTCMFEIDMAKVVAIRERLKGEFVEKHGVRLTYLPFVCRAVVDALQRWPRLNAEIRDDQVVTKSYVNLGIAVALDDGRGLIVPVIRNAEERNLLGITRAITDLAERARTKKLLPDDVQGGTFTITNPGGFGAIAGTPIINQPQVGIIDVEAVVKRPVVISDEHGNDVIAIRPMMNLCLSYDHRLVDGAYAAPFMRDVRANLETWDEEAY